MTAIEDDRNIVALSLRQSSQQGTKGLIGNVVDIRMVSSAVMRDDCLIVAIGFYAGRISHLRTVATVMEQHLIVERYSCIVDEECFKGLEDSRASGLPVREQEGEILWHSKLVHKKNAHRLNIIHTAIQIRYTSTLVLINTDEQRPERGMGGDL